MKTGESMIADGHVDDPETVKKDLGDLKLRWEALCTMSVTKQERLMNSLVLAKEMQSGSQALIRRLVDLEDILKRQGPIADEIVTLRNQIDDFQVCIFVLWLFYFSKILHYPVTGFEAILTILTIAT